MLIKQYLLAIQRLSGPVLNTKHITTSQQMQVVHAPGVHSAANTVQESKDYPTLQCVLCFGCNFYMQKWGSEVPDTTVGTDSVSVPAIRRKRFKRKSVFKPINNIQDVFQFTAVSN